jgi:6-phosphogluconolactonase (cycloisomerase 2 family)
MSATAIALVLAAAAATPAAAFRFKSCISATGAGPCTNIANAVALDNPSAVAVSPDGRFVYAASLDSDTVAWFARNPTTGALTFAGCLRGPDNGGGKCASLNYPRLITGPSALAISPDGAHLYVAAREGDALTVFDRNPQTGVPTFKDCMTSNSFAGCIGLQSGTLDGPVALRITSDGDELISVSGSGQSVGYFAIDDGGRLAFWSCVGIADLCVPAPHANALATPSALAISPDNLFVYVAAAGGDAITRLRLNEAFNRLEYVDCLGGVAAGGCSGIGNAVALDGPSALAMSGNGAHLYAAARNGNAVSVFGRNGTTGALGFAGCDGVTSAGPCNGTGNGNAVTAPAALAAGPAGTRVYSAAGGGNAVADFARGTDPLAFLGCVSANGAGPCGNAGNAAGLAGPTAIAASPDGRNLYVAAGAGNAIGVLGVAPPACAPISASTPFQTPVRMAFACSEPDGDALSYSISGAAHGALGGLDAGAAGVLYTPNAGYAGGDAFRYGAADIDGGSTAAASVAVGAPPVVVPPEPITSPIRNRWAYGPRRTEIIVLLVRLVPGDATVQVRCSAPRRLGKRACPFKRRSARPKSDLASVNVKKLFRKRRVLRVGVKIQIRITAPNSIGKVVTYKMRSSKLPKSVTRCLPPGATKPVKC